MRNTMIVTRLVTALLVSAAVGACGGEIGHPETVPPDAGGGGGGGGDGGTTIIEPDGAVCVDITLAGYDQSCTEDADCTGIYVGQICEGSCFGCVPNSAINSSDSTRYEEQTAPVSGGDVCPCPASGFARCVSNACIWCDSFGTNQAPGCETTFDAGGDDTFDGGDDSTDGGSGDDSIDGGSGDDGGIGDASACVFIDPASYSTSCQVNTDCTTIVTGEVCDGACDCGGTPVNVAGETQYEQAISGITFAGCPCAAEAPPACASGVCVSCNCGAGDPPQCAETCGG
jgi:hypothetical protein